MTEDDSGVPTPPKLPGEAAPGRYGVRTGDGVSTDPSRAIFPIVRFMAESKVELLGTGFFISTNGLFVTARHVLSAPFDSKGRQVYPIAMVHRYQEGSVIMRPILRCAQHPIADVTVGVAAPMNRNSDGAPLTNPILTLTTASPPLQTRVVTYAYPRAVSFMLGGVPSINWIPGFYDGEIAEYLPNGRDRVLLPGPCYRTSIIIHHGASGGPVFSPMGAVFAVNSTGFDGTEVSYVSRITEVFDLTIDDVIMDNQAARSVRVIEMARAGHIVVKPPLPQT
jgi:Trypsin-like peptidase domain